MSDEAATTGAGEGGGRSMSDAAAAIGGLLSGPPRRARAATTTTTDTAADAGADAPPADERSPTGDAAPAGESQEPSGDDEDRTEPDAAAQAEEQPPIEPPQSWDAADKEAFAKLDRAAQEIIHRRETARDKEVRRLQNDVATLRKGGDAQVQQAATQLQQHLSHLGQLAEALQQQVADEFADVKTQADLQKMAAEDPARYVRFQARSQLLQQVEQHRQAQKRAEAEKRAAHRAQFLEAEHAKLSEHPEAKILAAVGKDGDTARAELRSFLTDTGFSPDEVAGLEDSRAAAIAYKAMLYDKAKKSIAAAKQNPLPPATLRPGTASTKQDRGEGETAALVNRARKTGSLQDAGRAIARLM
jgi:hypothetical protein